ncbi:MAG TPA: glycosyl hydrolase family 28-related protein [Chitinophagaceae bacterium]|nr:glycosyl hydrolase family 28-related protein [Chitinophagaceae bacterium]
MKNGLGLVAAIFFAHIIAASQNTVSNFDSPSHGTSFYQEKLTDSEAMYFVNGEFTIASDGSADVSDALQQSINNLKTTHNFGILFIPEGKYLITKTIYIPQGIRLIGYGHKRPVIILGKNSPGFQQADSTDKGQAKYMFWFTSSIPQPGKPVNDAGAGTFYSALSNVNLAIEDGNPFAVALRTHYAQHSFIAHVDINTGNGKAGMFDVGNEMEDVRFFGGDYGIYTTKPSPGWQFMMIDTYFEGQRLAAIRSREAGLTIVRMQVKNTPAVIDVMPNFHEELFMEDCRFENISGPAITISVENNASNQLSLRNIACSNVPVFVKYRQSGKQANAPAAIYRVINYMHGLQMDSLHAEPAINTIQQMQPLTAMPAAAEKDIPALPPINTWVNLKTLGAKGDGVTDDTKVIQDAINKYDNIYVPQGWYRVTETIRLKAHTMLLGLTPIGTQFLLDDNTEAFGSFGDPEPLLETSTGGVNIVSGIGLSTGADNPRALACKWMAGRGSYMNDVKFIGGHGSMNRIWNNTADSARDLRAYKFGNAADPAWDTQYWSLWITNNGTGTFTDIWTANTYASAGTYVSNTNVPGRIYAMSVEHHVRNEVRFNNVANWKVYALQLEEESREGTECQPLELENCHNMVFANLYMFRVIRIIKPYPYSIRNWSSSNIEFLNVHNYSQIKYTTTNPLYDVNTNTTVRPWEFNRLYIHNPLHGMQNALTNSDGARQLATGFEFAEGACRDSKGNIYFCDSRLRRIYKWDIVSKSLSLLADYHWEPLSLACDTKDNLLVVFKYVPKKGYLKDGKPEVFVNPPDASGTSFSGWGNSGFATWVYSINPANPDETIQLLSTKAMGNIQHVAKALYPAHRWRDGHDFNTVTVNQPEECFAAPDGVTIIPVVYDLARAACLSEGSPGKPMYVTNEYEKTTVRVDVANDGLVSNLAPFAEKGEFSSAVDDKGNVYIADGQVYVFDKTGRQVKVIHVPERPATIVLGKDGRSLYITSNNSLYRMPIDK